LARSATLGLAWDLLERGFGLVVAAGRLGQDLLGESARVLRLVQPSHGDAQRPAQQANSRSRAGRRLARRSGSRRDANKRGQRAPLVGLGRQTFENSAVTSASVGASA